MHPLIAKIEQSHYKPTTPAVQSGDTVRVHQQIREGNKQRIQMFEGVVIRTHRMGSVTATLTVRRIASGVGVEKTFLLHSPTIDKIEIIRRAKVRRNFLSYLRERRGKSARLQEVGFDKTTANTGTANVRDEEVDDVPQADDAQGQTDQPDDVTDIDPDESSDELKEADISTAEVAKEENKEAAAEDAKSSDGPTDQPDEAVVPAEEFEAGVDRAQPNE